MIGFLALILSLAPAYLIRFHIFNLPTTLLETMLLVFLLITFTTAKKSDWAKIRKLGQINLAIGLFVLAGIISIIVAPQTTAALGQFKAFILEPVLMFYASMLLIKNKGQLLIVLRSLLVAAILISIFGIFQYYSLIHLPLRFWGNGPEVERITSIFDYPNALSLYLAPLLGLFIALWLNDYPLTKNRWLSGLGLALMIVALLLTFSRGAWLALALVLVWILIKRFGRNKIIWPIFGSIVLALLVPGVRQRLGSGIADPSSLAHFDLIRIGWQQILAHPIFGQGLTGFAQLQLGVNYPHNIFLNFWLELGLLGLIGFGWIMVLAFRQYQNKKQPLYLAASAYLLILLIHGLVDVPYFKNDLSLLFWFVISIFYL